MVAALPSLLPWRRWLRDSRRASRAGSATSDTVCVAGFLETGAEILILLIGVTPFVDPEHLKFFFEEVHRLTK
jgi:hypothetical protein